MPTDLATAIIHSAAYQALRAELKAGWQAANTPCAECGQATIDWDAPANDALAFELDHMISRKRAMAMNRPDLLLEPSNMAPTHHKCNRAKGAGSSTPPIGEMSEEY